MKVNKFKLFSYLGLGLFAVSTVAKGASIISPIAKVDPRIYAAGTVAEVSSELLDYGGNYLWNSEVAEQNKGVLSANFREVRFESSLKENKRDEWEEVSYWNLDRL